MNDPEIYIVDGLIVRAESERHAAKYYRRVIGRVPETVITSSGEKLETLAFCENTGLAIFCNDRPGVHFEVYEDGPYALSAEEEKRMRELAP